MQDHHRLEIWQRAMTFTVSIYEFTSKLPAEERFNLTDQLRRAATSVPLNVAEGAAGADGEFFRFLGYAYRSLQEVLTGLELCRRLYPTAPITTLQGLIDEGNQIGRMIRALMLRIDSGHAASRRPSARRKTTSIK